MTHHLFSSPRGARKEAVKKQAEAQESAKKARGHEMAIHAQEELRQRDELKFQKEKDAKLKAIQDYKTQQSIRQLTDVQDQVSLSGFVWEKEKEDVELKTDNSAAYLTSINLKDNPQEMLRHMGQKIDMSGKLPQLKHDYIQSVIQSRSHNFFLAKYAQFKVGVIGKLLTAMNISPEELQSLQKRAIDDAIRDNIATMSENIYNQELAELVHGRSAKNRQAQKVFKEIEGQLLSQMEKLGKKDYWSRMRLLEEKIAQCKKIEEELTHEKESLSYQLLFHSQRES